MLGKEVELWAYANKETYIPPQDDNEWQLVFEHDITKGVWCVILRSNNISNQGKYLNLCRPAADTNGAKWDVNQDGAKSTIKGIASTHVDNKYIFKLVYPDLCDTNCPLGRDYIIFEQTSDPTKDETVTGEYFFLYFFVSFRLILTLVFVLFLNDWYQAFECLMVANLVAEIRTPLLD